MSETQDTGAKGASAPAGSSPDFSSLRTKDRMRVIVTRPIKQALLWLDVLNAHGVESYPIPLIDIEPLADTGPIQRAWEKLSWYSLVMFVSANAVQHFFCEQTGWRKLALVGIGCQHRPGYHRRASTKRPAQRDDCGAASRHRLRPAKPSGAA